MKLARISAGFLAGTLVLAGYAAGAGPSPGLDTGIGVTRPGGALRFIALRAGHGTLIEAVRVRGGRVMRSRYLEGRYGVPLVTYGGDTGGLARNAPRLVLASATGRQTTRFLVLDPRTLKVRARIALRGAFAFDALSPGGSVMYLLEFREALSSVRYAVRAFNLDTRRLYPGAIVDRREPDEKMTGLPLTRVGSDDASWAYTLYSRDSGGPFVHALHTTAREAFCIDLPLKVPDDQLGRVRMRVSVGKLTIRLRGKTLATIDTRTFEVTH
jgi:hypothetical protein